jgi:hypothetical protein
MSKPRIWLLNSAVLPAGRYGTYVFAPASWDELREAVSNSPIVSRIGYSETADLIERMTGWRPPESREAADMEPGDVAFIVRLKYRVVDPGTKGQPTGARLDDWEVARLEYRAAPPR